MNFINMCMYVNYRKAKDLGGALSHFYERPPADRPSANQDAASQLHHNRIKGAGIWLVVEGFGHLQTECHGLVETCDNTAVVV